jgi:hypothetical protein
LSIVFEGYDARLRHNQLYMKRKPTYSVREACSLIIACDSIGDVTTLKNLLVPDIESYSISDQGFLMAMIGLQIIKIEDGTDNFDRLFRACAVCPK